MEKANEERTIKVGVIGCGYWGKNLVRVFNQLGCLEIICDTNQTIGESYRKNLPEIHFTENPDEVIKSKNIQAVVIATPAFTHYRLAKSSIEHGKHVFCEKPLAINIDEGQDLVKLAKKMNVILMVGHILHYHPAVKKLKQIISQGQLGKIHYMYSNRTNIGRIRHEENILWSFAPHDISLMLSISGNLPVEVCAHGGIFLPHEVEDVTVTFLSFPGNIKAHIFVSWLNPFKEQKFVVVGNDKMAVFDDTEVEKKLVIYQHKIKWNEKEIPAIEKAEAETIAVGKTEPLKNEAEHFIQCILQNRTPLTDGQEALNVLKVLDMATKSLRRKK